MFNKLNEFRNFSLKKRIIWVVRREAHDECIQIGWQKEDDGVFGRIDSILER